MFQRGVWSVCSINNHLQEGSQADDAGRLLPVLSCGQIRHSQQCLEPRAARCARGSLPADRDLWPVLLLQSEINCIPALLLQIKGACSDSQTLLHSCIATAPSGLPQQRRRLLHTCRSHSKRAGCTPKIMDQAQWP